MRTAEECRVKATAMDMLALAATDPDVRQTYTLLAALWRLVAKKAERQDDPLNHIPTLG